MHLHLFGNFQNTDVLSLETFLEQERFRIARAEEVNHTQGICLVCLSADFPVDTLAIDLLDKRTRQGNVHLLPVLFQRAEVPILFRDLRPIDFRDRWEHATESLLRTLRTVARQRGWSLR